MSCVNSQAEPAHTDTALIAMARLLAPLIDVEGAPASRRPGGAPA